VPLCAQSSWIFNFMSSCYLQISGFIFNINSEDGTDNTHLVVYQMQPGIGRRSRVAKGDFTRAEAGRVQCILSGCSISGGKWLAAGKHVALHERGRKKVCLDVEQSYMACYGWNRILCGMHCIASGRDLVPEGFEGKWRGNNLPMWTFVLSEPCSTCLAH
jgi:hypothetical protein